MKFEDRETREKEPKAKNISKREKLFFLIWKLSIRGQQNRSSKTYLFLDKADQRSLENCLSEKTLVTQREQEKMM